MSHAGKKHSAASGILRLGLFWIAGAAATWAYIEYLTLPVPGTPVGTAICVAGCFVISVVMGLWKKAIPAVVRALTAASCVAIPLVVAIVENVGNGM